LHAQTPVNPLDVTRHGLPGRIAAGDYGDCASCGEEIPKNRLEALPFAVRCIACEGTREHDDARVRKLTRGGAMLGPIEARL